MPVACTPAVAENAAFLINGFADRLTVFPSGCAAETLIVRLCPCATLDVRGSTDISGGMGCTDVVVVVGCTDVVVVVGSTDVVVVVGSTDVVVVVGCTDVVVVVA